MNHAAVINFILRMFREGLKKPLSKNRVHKPRGLQTCYFVKSGLFQRVPRRIFNFKGF